ncbi:Hypothetical protein, putative [Bodo saltans]|uniref:Galactose oxidase n=1 Tax=Bodo saltans TaxID=75058 RepID=A0A0S4IRC6_BODSA|nr:Hypothetical protein, putative [Bodo saltans]|eukprot:CUF44551.1 Hypothetical protein, putative [Bodo saltans]
MQQASGISACIYGHSAVVYGGKHNRWIYYLDLLTLEWQADACTGVAPPPTLFHSAVIYDRYLYVCGGATLSEAAEEGGLPNVRPNIAYRSMRPLRMYRLDLAQLEWELIEVSGAIPTDRSHHTMAIAGNNPNTTSTSSSSAPSTLVLLGGKPIGQTFTTSQFKQHFNRVSFFDPFVLDLKTNVWRRVDMPGTAVPRLWGHAMCCLDSGAGSLGFGVGGISTISFLIHGGVELLLDDGDDIETTTDSGSLPLAEINSSLYVLSVDAHSCTAFPPREGELTPPPRLLHSALMRGRGELVVLGGLVIDTSSASVLSPVLEMWSWSPNSGVWRPAPFCYDEDHVPPPKPYPFSKFCAVVYGETVVVVSTDMSMVHLYDGVRWTSMPCTPPSPPLPNPEETNPLYFIGNPFLPENLIADEISLSVASTTTNEQQQQSSGAFHRHAGSVDTTQSATDDVANELRHAAEDIHSMRSLVQSAVRAAHQQHPSPSSQQAIGERGGFSLSDVAQRTLRGVHPSSSLSPVLTLYANSLIDGIRKPNSGGVGTGNGRQGSAAVDPASVRELLAQERQVVRQRLSVRQDDPHKWHH